MILHAQVGSGVHGTAVVGQDDRDNEMGICLEPPEHVTGVARVPAGINETSRKSRSFTFVAGSSAITQDFWFTYLTKWLLGGVCICSRQGAASQSWPADRIPEKLDLSRSSRWAPDSNLVKPQLSYLVKTANVDRGTASDWQRPQ